MACTPAQQPREFSLGLSRVRVGIPADVCRADRMARFVAGARRVWVRAVTVGGLVAAGWLLAVLFGMLSAAPAAADTTTVTGDGAPLTATGSFTDGFPTDGGTVTASEDAEAMAGLTVDGLTSQSDPGLPPPSSADSILDTDGLVPSGGNGPFGPGMGDVARSAYDPRLDVRRAAPAYVLPPVVRTAADDPSFSPD